MHLVTKFGTMARTLWAVLPIAFCLAAAAHAQSTGTCPGICDLSEVLPVCGADGITYQTSCIALCQGVAVAASGPCKAREGSRFTAAQPISTAGAGTEPATVGIAVMQRFKDEGFVFIGVGKSDPNFQPKKLTARSGGRARVPRHNSAAVRYVAETGFMYSTTSAGSPLTALLKSLGQAENAGTQANGASVSSTVAFDPSFKPPIAQKNASQASADVTGTPLEGDTLPDGSTAPINAAEEDIAGVLGNLGRKLMQTIAGQTIFGADDRVRVSPTNSYPWSGTGLVEFAISGTSYTCSGAMITPTSVLTAAHCVHGGRGGAWASTIKFSPGADGSRRPYGTVDWSYATTYAEWINNGCSGSCSVDRFYYDLAVITLSQSVGTTAGWFGLTSSDTFDVQATTAGYPADKPFGTQWRVSCRVTDTNSTDFLTTTTCLDTKGGQSGSPLWETSKNVIRAVNSHESSANNGFVQITTPRFWDVITWAGDSYTNWNDAGATNGYKSIYLDRHDLSFCSGVSAMSAFRLQMLMTASPPRMRMAYKCDGTTGVGTLARFTTAANDWGNGNVIFLDRHNVACPANHVLRRWRLFRPSSNQIAFEYFCAPKTLSGCEGLATAWNDNGNGQVNYLDRHPVVCPGGKVLTQWVLQTDNIARQMRIAFTCCNAR